MKNVCFISFFTSIISYKFVHFLQDLVESNVVKEI